MMQTERPCPAALQEESPSCLFRFFCKLFDDMIVEDLCRLRRHELNDRTRFSCRGCSKDLLITSSRALRSS